MKQTIRYSEAFKRRVVRAIEEGEMDNCYQAQMHYGVRGTGTVGRWVRQYGKNQIIGKVLRVETPDEKSEVKQLKQRVRLLEKALADSTLDLAIERALIDVIGEEFGVADMAAFKKNATAKLRKEP